MLLNDLCEFDLFVSLNILFLFKKKEVRVIFNQPSYEDLEYIFDQCVKMLCHTFVWINVLKIDCLNLNLKKLN